MQYFKIWFIIIWFKNISTLLNYLQLSLAGQFFQALQVRQDSPELNFSELLEQQFPRPYAASVGNQQSQQWLVIITVLKNYSFQASRTNHKQHCMQGRS